MSQKWFLVEEVMGETDDPNTLAGQVIRAANSGKAIDLDLNGTDREGGRMILLPSGKAFIIDPPKL